ncbi:MAG: acetyl-coenzyme A synthetase, partial [Bdellovibrionaceae bacterium]|nr:acetyl-coenzyme A synthetase [Pseudobdellovibrionaceae bacterium]
MQIQSIHDFDSSRKKSKTSAHDYWLEIAREYDWKVFPQKTLEGSFRDLPLRWFADGQLNITENTLDRHVKNNPHSVAIYFEPNDPTQKESKYTYKQLLESV